MLVDLTQRVATAINDAPPGTYAAPYDTVVAKASLRPQIDRTQVTVPAVVCAPLAIERETDDDDRTSIGRVYVVDVAICQKLQGFEDSDPVAQEPAELAGARAFVDFVEALIGWLGDVNDCDTGEQKGGYLEGSPDAVINDWELITLLDESIISEYQTAFAWYRLFIKLVAE